VSESDRIAAPLHFLPAFELAARYLSVKRAAEELHLSPSAVSQQIRALEDALGFKLFHRLTRALALTDAGEQFAEVVRDTLHTYRSGTGRVQRRHVHKALRLSTDPFVAHELLIPQLHGFRAENPGIDLRIETSASVADLRRDGADVAIRYGRGPWPGLASTLLCHVTATAVSKPGLVKRDRLRSPAALARYPLIALRHQADPWQKLGVLLGVELPSERLLFDGYFDSLRAAREGLGIALALFPPTSDLVERGLLATPLQLHVRVRNSFQLVCRKEDTALPELQALRSWTLVRFAALRRVPPGSEPWPSFDEP
jgi:LysR family glycine cleavage system transcriptional activator